LDTKELIAQAKARYNHQQSRQALHAKYTSQLTLTYGGGLWDITPELIAFLAVMTDKTIILTDSYDKPLTVDRQELLELLKQKYTEVMTEWVKENTELSKLR
jgi:hypothetical protein